MLKEKLNHKQRFGNKEKGGVGKNKEKGTKMNLKKFSWLLFAEWKRNEKYYRIQTKQK